MQEFNIYLTFDIDQDFNPNSRDYYNRSKADFSSFERNFSLLIEKLGNLPFSVFIRADKQIKSLYGSYDYLLINNPQLIDLIIKANGEINWHIHLYELINNEWAQIKDDQKLISTFLDDYLEVQKIEKINSNIIRIGECVMSNSLMNTINQLGIKIDSTALPRRKRIDEDKDFDWELTKNNIYHPSKDDYRTSGEDQYSVLEVPMSTLPMQAIYDKVPLYRYFNLSFKTEVLFENFREYVMSHNELITITHPFEVLSDGSHGLISYDLNVFIKNIQLLKEQVEQMGKKVVFKKISNII